MTAAGPNRVGRGRRRDSGRSTCEHRRCLRCHQGWRHVRPTIDASEDQTLIAGSTRPVVLSRYGHVSCSPPPCPGSVARRCPTCCLPDRGQRRGPPVRPASLGCGQRPQRWCRRNLRLRRHHSAAKPAGSAPSPVTNGGIDGRRHGFCDSKSQTVMRRLDRPHLQPDTTQGANRIVRAQNPQVSRRSRPLFTVAAVSPDGRQAARKFANAASSRYWISSLATPTCPPIASRWPLLVHLTIDARASRFRSRGSPARPSCSRRSKIVAFTATVGEHLRRPGAESSGIVLVDAASPAPNGYVLRVAITRSSLPPAAERKC